MTKFTFQSVSELPEIGKPVLLKYKKGSKSYYTGQKGEFLTQGYYLEKKFDWDPILRRVWYDYTDRQIQDLNAKGSKNEVIEWAYI